MKTDCISTGRGKVTVVLDSQAGSCGKGKFIGYLAKCDHIGVAINNFMSNAGHTWVDGCGGAVMTQHLPTSIVNDGTILMIGPGAAITPEILINEIIKFKNIIRDRVVYIHPRAMVILPKHAEKEREIIRSGSTFKGCGVAQAEKIIRRPGTMLFGEWYKVADISQICNTSTGSNFTQDELQYIVETICVVDTMPYLNDLIDDGADVIVEGSQGCDLDINYGLNYPHTTSRQCHAGQLVADCGISPRLVDEVIMIMRPYPIRISNTTNVADDDGNTLVVSSGDYNGSAELSWDEIKKRCGAPDGVEFGEMTTVTKKMRRVFEMNWKRLKYVTALNRPTQIALNFVQYIDYDALHCTKYDQLPEKVKEFIRKVEDVTGVPVTLIGTGARNNHIIDRRKK